MEAVFHAGNQHPHELADSVGFLVQPLENEALDLHRDHPVATAGVQAEFAHGHL
jgi:hypothetical protein